MVGGDVTGRNQSGCEGCRVPADFHDLAMAFQPIVDVRERCIFAYEALVRGPQNQSAYSVISAVAPDQMYGFDQQ